MIFLALESQAYFLEGAFGVLEFFVLEDMGNAGTCRCPAISGKSQLLSTGGEVRSNTHITMNMRLYKRAIAPPKAGSFFCLLLVVPLSADVRVRVCVVCVPGCVCVCVSVCVCVMVFVCV